MIKLSKNQLAKLVLHNMQISTILVEACLTPEPSEADEPEVEKVQDNAGEIEIDLAPWEQEQPGHNALLDAMCGKWKGQDKKQPSLFIRKTFDGYMVAYGRMDKRKDIYPDLFLLYSEKEYAYFNVEDERIYVSLGTDTDNLILSPGGNFTREAKQKK